MWHNPGPMPGPGSGVRQLYPTTSKMRGETFSGFKNVRPPKGYAGHIQTGPLLPDGRPSRMRTLNPMKYAQRVDLARKVKRGRVLELYAGRGALFKTVWRSRSDKNILVDKQPARIPGAEVEKMSVEKYLRTELPNLDHPVAAVDVDPYGSPGKTVQLFFKNYPYKIHRLHVGITDGYAMRLGLLKSDADQAAREVDQRYLTPHFGDASRENQLRLDDNLMREMGRRHDLKVTRVNATHNDARTIYAGYRFEDLRG